MPKDSPTTPAGRITPTGMPQKTAPRSAHAWLRALKRGFERKYARNNEILIVALAAVIGSTVGFLVVSIQGLLRLLHDLVFGLPPGLLLSEGAAAVPWRIVAAPCIGGLLVGLFIHWIRKVRTREVVDPVEANALYGGRMSLVDSLRLTTSTLMSAGSGASVGMEAAYSQLGAGLASKAGQLARLRRIDLRLLVGCGAAASLAAAFNAPFAGAFYAFELIIGSYSSASLAPVVVSALTSMLVARSTIGADPIFSVVPHVVLQPHDYAMFALVGVAAAGFGILTMRTVTTVEKYGKRLPVPAWLRPAVGGLAVGLIALWFPEVLGSGQGAIQDAIDREHPVMLVAGLLFAKAAASAISVGSGFRGGLFSSSLFLGALLGSCFAVFASWMAPGLAVDRVAFVLVGMGAVAAAIVGTPITMTLLVLELTGDFAVTAGVMIAVVTASFMVRQTFGYSFSTWRFHIRGVPIRGAHDIGWIRDLTVGSLMREDVHTAPQDMPLAELRARFPLGGTKHVFLVDDAGNYAGIVSTMEAHDPELDAKLDGMRACDIRHGATQYLLACQNVRAALNRFVHAEMETLAVVAKAGDRRPVGYLTEAYALRRYNQELEQSRAAELKDSPLFGPT